MELILGSLISCHLLISSTEANSRLICLGSDIPANWKCLSSIPGMAAMSSYSTSARLVIYMGRPNEISHSSILPKLPRGSLANFNSDTLQGTCGNRKQTNDTRKKEKFFFSNNSLSHACLSSYEFFFFANFFVSRVGFRRKGGTAIVCRFLGDLSPVKRKLIYISRSSGILSQTSSVRNT